MQNICKIPVHFAERSGAREGARNDDSTGNPSPPVVPNSGTASKCESLPTPVLRNDPTGVILTMSFAALISAAIPGRYHFHRLLGIGMPAAQGAASLDRVRVDRQIPPEWTAGVSAEKPPVFVTSVDATISTGHDVYLKCCVSDTSWRPPDLVGKMGKWLREQGSNLRCRSQSPVSYRLDDPSKIVWRKADTRLLHRKMAPPERFEWAIRPTMLPTPWSEATRSDPPL